MEGDGGGVDGGWRGNGGGEKEDGGEMEGGIEEVMAGGTLLTSTICSPNMFDLFTEQRNPAVPH